MKTFLALLVLWALTFNGCISTNDNTLKAGAAETVITPEVILKSLEWVKWVGAVGDGHYALKEGELMPAYDDLVKRVFPK